MATKWIKNRETGKVWEVEDGEYLERCMISGDFEAIAAPAPPKPDTRLANLKGQLVEPESLGLDELKALAANKAKTRAFVTIPDTATPADLIAFLRS